MPERPLAIVQPSKWWAGFFAIGTMALFMTALAYADRLPDVFRIGGADKIAHFATTGLLAFFLDGALRRRAITVGGSIAVPLAAAIILVPVGIEEFLQRYAPLRTSSIWDFAADVAGVALLIPLSRRLAA
jgi:VanZ family protein